MNKISRIFFGISELFSGLPVYNYVELRQRESKNAKTCQRPAYTTKNKILNYKNSYVYNIDISSGFLRRFTGIIFSFLAVPGIIGEGVTA